MSLWYENSKIKELFPDAFWGKKARYVFNYVLICWINSVLALLFPLSCDLYNLWRRFLIDRQGATLDRKAGFILKLIQLEVVINSYPVSQQIFQSKVLTL